MSTIKKLPVQYKVLIITIIGQRQYYIVHSFYNQYRPSGNTVYTTVIPVIIVLGDHNAKTKKIEVSTVCHQWKY